MTVSSQCTVTTVSTIGVASRNFSCAPWMSISSPHVNSLAARGLVAFPCECPFVQTVRSVGSYSVEPSEFSFLTPQQSPTSPGFNSWLLRGKDEPLALLKKSWRLPFPVATSALVSGAGSLSAEQEPVKKAPGVRISSPFCPILVPSVSRGDSAPLLRGRAGDGVTGHAQRREQ